MANCNAEAAAPRWFVAAPACRFRAVKSLLTSSAPPSLYLDHGGTTPLDPHVLEGLRERLGLPLGNPNAAHGPGAEARQMLEDARRTLASHLGGRAEEVVFTSGGTESITLAIRGCTAAPSGRILLGATEHSATRTAAESLLARGWTLEHVPVTPTGRITPETLEKALTPETRIVCLMMAQNEIGTVTEIAALAPVVRRCAPRARLVVDAVQAFSKVPFRVSTLGADCVAVTAHKMNGPLGIGALWTRAAVAPLFKGGGQERGQRGGTQPAVLAWAFAEATARAFSDTSASARMSGQRDALVAAVLAEVPDATLTGEPSGPTRLPNNAHFCIPGLPSEPLINALAEAGVSASAGAACSTGKGRVSPTLQALGRSADEGAFLRLTLGRFTRDDELPEAARRIGACVRALRRAYAGHRPGR